VAGVAALLFEVGQQIVPCSEEFAAVIADNPRIGLGISRNSQPDGETMGTLKPVIEILGGHSGCQFYAGTRPLQV
jgi:hypothetical protein